MSSKRRTKREYDVSPPNKKRRNNDIEDDDDAKNAEGGGKDNDTKAKAVQFAVNKFRQKINENKQLKLRKDQELLTMKNSFEAQKKAYRKKRKSVEKSFDRKLKGNEVEIEMLRKQIRSTNEEESEDGNAYCSICYTLSLHTSLELCLSCKNAVCSACWVECDGSARYGGECCMLRDNNERQLVCGEKECLEYYMHETECCGGRFCEGCSENGNLCDCSRSSRYY